MNHGLFDGGGDGRLTSFGLLEISKTYATQDDIFHGALPFYQSMIVKADLILYL